MSNLSKEMDAMDRLAQLAREANAQSASENKIEMVHRILKTALLNNEIPCGTVMAERPISEAMNVSRSPVRESLKRLCVEGLLVMAENGTILVTDITEAETMELYDLLEVVEVHTVQKCIQKLDPQFVATLAELIHKYEAAVTSGDIRQAIWCDYDFHIAIIRHAMFRRMEPVLFQLNGQRVRIMNALIDGEMDILREALRQHKDIYKAIVERNVTAAEQHIRAHVYTVKDYYRQRFAKQQTR